MVKRVIGFMTEKGHFFKTEAEATRAEARQKLVDVLDRATLSVEAITNQNFVNTVLVWVERFPGEFLRYAATVNILETESAPSSTLTKDVKDAPYQSPEDEAEAATASD